MEIILKEDIEKLGFKNEIVIVKDGYGRNFLIPKGLADIATPSSKKMREETIRQRAHKEEKLVKEADAMVEKLTKAKISVSAKAGEKGKIFGSVNNIQLAASLKEQGIKIDRKSIHLKEENIKSLGTYQATIKIYKKIEITVDFEVIAETE